MSRPLLIRRLRQVDYLPCWQAMKAFTLRRDADTDDELWLVQHPPVFTLGRAGLQRHILAPGAIPVVHCDRGGQATYHGPGQVIAYLLLDVRRLGLHVRPLVERIEGATTALLGDWGVRAHGDRAAPGIYVGGRKIASLGLRLCGGRTYHGLALNHDMDMAPWQRINPCGYAGLAMTSLAREGVVATRAEVENGLCAALCDAFGLQAQPSAAPEFAVDSLR